MTWETYIVYDQNTGTYVLEKRTMDRYKFIDAKTCCTYPAPVPVYRAKLERHFTPLSYCIIGVLAIALITNIVLAIRHHKKSKTDNNLPNN